MAYPCLGLWPITLAAPPQITVTFIFPQCCCWGSGPFMCLWYKIWEFWNQYKNLKLLRDLWQIPRIEKTCEHKPSWPVPTSLTPTWRKRCSQVQNTKSFCRMVSPPLEQQPWYTFSSSTQRSKLISQNTQVNHVQNWRLEFSSLQIKS